MIKREISSEEVQEIAALAAAFDDLRKIRPLIAELQQRLDDVGSVTLDAVIVRPRSVSDLIALHAAKLVDDVWVKQRLGIAAPASAAVPDATPDHGDADPDYTIKDRRVAS